MSEMWGRSRNIDILGPGLFAFLIHNLCRKVVRIILGDPRSFLI